MAVSLPPDVKRDILECKICLEVIKTPKALDCLHTFCECCIDDLHTRSRSNNISCPVCRHSTVLPKTGANGLRTNFLINTLQDAAAQNLPAAKCGYCDEDATHICMNCHDKVCFPHGVSHPNTRFTRGHKVVKISDVQAGKYKEEMQAFGDQHIECPHHPGKDLEFYCTQCCTILCVSCKVLEHNAHECTTLKNAGDQKLANIDNLLEESKGVYTFCVNYKISLDGNFNKLLQDRVKINQDIDGLADHLCNTIRLQQNALKDGISSFVTQKHKEHKLEQDDMNSKIARVESIMSYGEALVKHGNSVDVLQFDSHARQSLNSVTKELNPKVQQEQANSMASMSTSRYNKMRRSQSRAPASLSAARGNANVYDQIYGQSKKNGYQLSFSENKGLTNMINQVGSQMEYGRQQRQQVVNNIVGSVMATDLYYTVT